MTIRRVAATLGLLVVAASTIEAQGLRYYPRKNVAPGILNPIVTTDRSFFLGPSVGFDAFVRESKTGSYQLGIIPGVGYGAKWASADGKRIHFALDVFVQGSAADESDAHDGLDFFNIDVLPVATLFNWVSVGVGPRFKMGLDGMPSENRMLFSFGIRKAT